MVPLKCLHRTQIKEAISALIPHLLVFLHVPDLHLTPQVPKSSQDQDVTLRTEDRKDDMVRVCSQQRQTKYVSCGSS